MDEKDHSEGADWVLPSVEKPAYDTPRFPFYVDDEGDICDVNGWLVLCPAQDVWPDDRRHAEAICHMLNRR